MHSKLKILCFVSYYIPGYKAGGPLKTIANMVENLGDEFEFFIVTRDRDLGDDVEYFNIKPNEWNNIGKAKVFYAPSSMFTLNKVSSLVQESSADILYLNSYFDPLFTGKPLLSRLLGLHKNTPIIIAPRGEFSLGALALKSFKKRLFIKFTQSIGFYKNIFWQASSEFEKNDIISALGLNQNTIFIAKDLPERKLEPIKSAVYKYSNSTLRVVFLSRISPMKNLDYALTILQNVSVPILFNIYGPQEDEFYWSLCERLIEELPNNVHVKYCGIAKPLEVRKIFSEHHLFFFPTRGENYGHVIAESLSVGTPVLISDQTPWKHLKKDALGWDLPLQDIGAFLNVIESCYRMLGSEYFDWRNQIIENAALRINNKDDVEANKALFLSSLNRIDS